MAVTSGWFILIKTLFFVYFLRNCWIAWCRGPCLEDADIWKYWDKARKEKLFPFFSRFGKSHHYIKKFLPRWKILSWPKRWVDALFKLIWTKQNMFLKSCSDRTPLILKKKYFTFLTFPELGSLGFSSIFDALSKKLRNWQNLKRFSKIELLIAHHINNFEGIFYFWKQYLAEETQNIVRIC